MCRNCAFRNDAVEYVSTSGITPELSKLSCHWGKENVWGRQISKCWESQYL